jgi:hypothetical protein
MNFTRPSILAKRVSSEPRPTLRPGLSLGAALADDDGTAGDDLAGEELHAEALGIGVAAVFGAA